MNEAETHFEYTTKNFDAVLRQYRALDSEARLDLVREEIVLLFARLNEEKVSTCSDLIEYALRYLSHVISHVVAFLVVDRGRQTWRDVFSDQEVGCLVAALYCDSSSAALQHTTFWHMAQWVHEGRRIFAPTEALCKRLESVQLRGVRGCDVALPYRSFYVMVPHSVGAPLPDYAGNNFPLRGLYVIEDDFDNHARKPGRVVHVVATGQWVTIEGMKHKDDQLYYWTIPLYVDDSERECCTRLRVAWDIHGGTEVPNAGDSLKRLRELGSWVWKLLVYLSDAEIRRETRYLDPTVTKLQEKLHKHKNGRKRDRIKEELAKRSRQVVIVVGSDVKAPAQSPRGTGTPLEVRQLVRGHTKRQPFGPGRQDRKQIIIAPYWRGPEEGAEGGSRFMLR